MFAIILDFDGVITKKSDLGARRATITEDQIREDIPNFAKLQQLLNTILASDHVLAIASHNDGRALNESYLLRHKKTKDGYLFGEPLIRKYLQVLVGAEQAALIQIEAFNAIDKNQHLANIAQRYSLLADKIILFDDKKSNVAAAKAQDYHVYLVNNDKPDLTLTTLLFTSTELQAVFAKKRKRENTLTSTSANQKLNQTFFQSPEAKKGSNQTPTCPPTVLIKTELGTTESKRHRLKRTKRVYDLNELNPNFFCTPNDTNNQNTPPNNIIANPAEENESNKRSFSH